MQSFGGHLRDARQAAGMSQAQLGGDTLSRSYISLLEGGQREPTDSVLVHLAERLGRPLLEVREWAMADRHREQLEDAADYTEALVALADGRLYDASVRGERLRRRDGEGEQGLAAWTAEQLRLIHASAADDIQAMEASCLRLSQHWLYGADGALRGRVLTSWSVAARSEGLLSLAASRAWEAVSLLDGEEHCTARLSAEIALISALGEAGEASVAKGRTATVLELVDRVGHTVESGKALWALGNIEFLAGTPEQGVAFHDRATELIDPNANLRSWARLQRVSALMRMRVGRTGPDIDELLDRAARAFSISATTTDAAEMLVARGMRAGSRDNASEALALFDEALTSRAVLPPQTVADVLDARGRARDQLGDSAGARVDYSGAAAILFSLGALARGLEICREHRIPPPTPAPTS